MTIPDADYRPQTSADLTRQTRREVLAVACIALGLCGVLGCAWALSPWLFGMLLSAGALGGGVYLGFSR